MAAQFVGKYSLVSSENFDEYMKAVGVGFALRKIAAGLKPDVTCEINGDEWTMKSISSFKTTVMVFKLGQEFEETTPDGRVVKTTITLEGDKLIQRQKPIKDGDKESEIHRYLKDDQLHIDMICGDVQGHRIYKRS